MSECVRPLLRMVISLCISFYRSDSGQAHTRCRSVTGLVPDLCRPLSILPERPHHSILPPQLCAC